MRLGWILAAAGALAACGQEEVEAPVQPDVSYEEPIESYEDPAAFVPDLDYRALSGYDEGWYVSPGWPGEYPAGFAILEADVTAPAWSVPNASLAPDLSCTLPQYANYQLWNRERTAKDDLAFFVATKTFPVTLSQAASIEYVSDNGMKRLDLAAGDQLTYLRYLGEGFTVVSFEGEEYDINEAELREISDIGTIPTKEDQWVRVACEDGSQAWLLYTAAIEHPGIVPSPIVGFGEAFDILPEEVDAVREAGEATAAAYEGIEPDDTLPVE